MAGAELRRAVGAALLASLSVAVGQAAAHEQHGIGRGYVSTVAAVQPNVVGLTALVVGGDDRLLVRNLSPRTVVIRGYDGEPYLRISPGGVDVNTRSPATYLNRFRYPPAATPARFRADAAPRWSRVSTSPSFDWHDHRIHWRKRTPPPAVAGAPRRSHKIFDWRVPATADGAPFAIVGFLGYVPPPLPAAHGDRDGNGGATWPLVVAAAVGGVLVLVALIIVARRRDGDEEAAAPPSGGGLP